MRFFCGGIRSTNYAGVSLVLQESSAQVTRIPSVLVEREASELRRGRPAVALDIVQVWSGGRVALASNVWRGIYMYMFACVMGSLSTDDESVILV